ncbi:MAG: DUF1553 domain-containing protein [Planctomycetales bacterium]
MKPNSEAVAFFESKVRPLLLNQCISCHGPEKQKGGLRLDSAEAIKAGGDSGEVLVAGDPDKSRFIEVIRYNSDLKMPPKSKLADAEIAILTQWVKTGAIWPPSAKGTTPAPAPQKPADPAAEEPLTPEQKQFWAFQPMGRHEPPAVQNAGWCRQPWDRFILARLEANKISPSKPADKSILIRRATYDLTGLLPTPEEVNAFLADNSPEAFAKVIDRLLDSPHYGERWGRHWLDLARYADSNGLDENLAYANAYRYRDYVIQAFNKDKPYDQFLREQLAGDLLANSPDANVNNERITATGFLSLGAKMLAEDDPVKMQMDIIDEQVDTIGRTVLGLTIGCARCHAHKYDPISMADYYGLAGIFKSTHTMDTFSVVAKWHERPVAPPAILQTHQRINDQIAKLKGEQAVISQTEDKTLLTSERNRAADYLQAATLQMILDGLLPQQATQGGGEKPLPGEIRLQGEKFIRGNVQVDTQNYGKGIGVIINGGTMPNFAEYEFIIERDKVYQLEIRYAAVESRPVEITLDGDQVASAALSKVTGSWEPGGQQWHVINLLPLSAGKHLLRIERNDAIPHIDQIYLAPVVITREREAEQVRALSENLPRDLRTGFVKQWVEYLQQHKADKRGPFAPWLAQLEIAEGPVARLVADLPLQLVLLKSRYQQGFQKADEAWALELAKDGSRNEKSGLNDPALEELRIVLHDNSGPCRLPKDPHRFYPLAAKQRWEALQLQIAAQEKTLPELPMTMAVMEEKPQNLKVHYRGNHLTLGPEVPRKFPRVLAGEQPAKIEAGKSGRLELAQWLTNPEHPLTARVMVNRLWLYHFGEGLVRSPDNFGRLGERPTHPELLDWLSQRFVASGWSLKQMHRELMLSATYQLSSSADPKVRESDPDNRLWSYMPRRRLDAEGVRDSILKVCDNLDPLPGGTLLKSKNREYVTSTANVNPVVYDTQRRSVYLPVVRSALFEVFQAFDFADPSTQNGRRDVTTVAPQALFMMNSDFVLKQTRSLAERLLGRKDMTDSDRLQNVYVRFFARPPKPVETERALSYLTHFEERAKTEKFHASELRLAAWQSLCRALLSSNEFLYVE